jgi:paraquat-inducible protein A
MNPEARTSPAVNEEESIPLGVTPISCPDCDLLHRVREIPQGRKALCARCGAVLYHPKKDSIDRTLALVIAGLILYWPANFYPIMRIASLGEIRETTMFSGVRELWAGGAWWVGSLVFMASILIPLVKLAGMCYVLLPLRLRWRPPSAGLSCRLLLALDKWGMLEVYMLGILVAMIKISAMATIQAGVGLYAFVALMLVSILVSTTLDREAVFARLEEIR